MYSVSGLVHEPEVVHAQRVPREGQLSHPYEGSIVVLLRSDPKPIAKSKVIYTQIVALQGTFFVPFIGFYGILFDTHPFLITNRGMEHACGIACICSFQTKIK